MRRYLVVANQTLGGGQLLQLLRHLAERPSSFHVLVPATPPSDHLWTESEAIGIARRRLETALERFRSIGAEEVTGEVGDGRPLQAIDDVLSRESFDEIVLSTLPPRAEAQRRENRLRTASQAFVGCSASRRMNHGYQCVP